MAKDDTIVLLVRHGVAEDKHPAGDEARALTEKGRRRFRRLARALRGEEVPLVGIATSPLVRAVQTAEIFAEALKVRRVEVHAELGGENPKAIVTLVRRLGSGWAHVGHNPTLTAAARLLAKENLDELEKGTVLALQPAGTAWKTLWRRDT